MERVAFAVGQPERQPGLLLHFVASFTQWPGSRIRSRTRHTIRQKRHGGTASRISSSSPHSSLTLLPPLQPRTAAHARSIPLNTRDEYDGANGKTAIPTIEPRTAPTM